MASDASLKRKPESFEKNKAPRTKLKKLMQVTMESEKAEVHLEPFCMKKKRMTARFYKSQFKRQRPPEFDGEQEGSDKRSHVCNDNNRGVVPEDVSGVTGECIRRAVPKLNGCLRGNDENRDTNVVPDLMVNVVHEPPDGNSLVDLQTSLGVREDFDDSEKLPTNCSILKDKNAPKSESSTRSESLRDDTVNSKIQQTLALKDKGARSEIYVINEIQKKCDKRLKKLILKQQREIQELRRIWEEKRLKLETDHKLESAIIRSIYGEGSARMNRLKLLDGIFAKHMEENNLLKDMKLKGLEAQQLAARNEESQKAARWLAEANACCSSERGFKAGAVVEQLNQPKLFGSGEIICENLPASGERVSDEMRSVELNEEVPGEVPETIPSEAVEDVNQVEVNNASSKRDAFSMPDASVEQLNQAKHFGNGDTTCKNTCASGERVSDETHSVELNKEVQQEVPETVPNEAGEDVNQVELSYASSKGDAISMPDDLIERLNQPKHLGTGDIICENTRASGERVSDEMQSVELNIEVRHQVPETVPNEAAEVLNQVEVNNASGKGDAISMPDASVEQLNQPKHFGNGDIICENTRALGERASDEMHSVELNKEVRQEVPATLPHEAVDGVNQVELSNVSTKEDAVDMPDALVNQRDGTDEITINGSPLAGKISEPSEKVEASASHHGMLPQQVPDDQVHQHVVSAELQDQAAEVVEKENTFQFEVAYPVPVAIVTVPHSNAERQDQNALAIESQSTSQTEAANTERIETVTPVQSHTELKDRDAPVVEGQSTLQIEVVDLELLEENLEMQGNETSVEPSVSPQSNAAISQGMVTAGQLPDVSHLQLGLDVVPFYRSSYPSTHPNHQVASWNSPSFFVEPLRVELAKICRETELLKKSHEDTMSRLKSDCEKEIQEIAAQIRNKYEAKLQDAEADFRLKKNELEKNHKTVLMNKILAEAFNSRCLDPSLFLHPGMQQVTPPGFMQHPHYQSLQQSVRPQPGASRLQMTSSSPQAMQQPSLPHPTGLNSVGYQQVPTPLVQNMQHPVQQPLYSQPWPPQLGWPQRAPTQTQLPSASQNTLGLQPLFDPSLPALGLRLDMGNWARLHGTS